MSLQLILGNSGSGKTHTLYQQIIKEAQRHPERNYFMIVPEQFTMQTQRDFVRMHPRHGIMNIDVLSFPRLAHRIFEEMGEDKRNVLTETGKNLMLRKVASQCRSQLKLLGNKMNRTGYVSEIKSILSELMQYEITDFDMQEMLKCTQAKPLLHTKLEDIRILYQEYLEYERERFMKPEELLDVLSRISGESKLLKNSILAFDGFTGFTPSQLKVMRELLKICSKLWITVTIDPRESVYGVYQEHELFALSKKTIRKVSDIANECKAQIEDPIIKGMNEMPRFRPGGALAHLEQNLFRKNRIPYKEDNSEISLHQVSSLIDEVHFAGRKIHQLVCEKNYHYRDIAVITGNLSSYNNYIKRIFPQYGVPVFVDETRHILLNPCLEFVQGALALAQKDFSAETVFRFLRTGMAGLSPEEIDPLENYVLRTGIRGKKRWMEEWKYQPGGIGEDILYQCEAARKVAMKNLEAFSEVMQKKEMRLREYAKALYELLVACEIQQKLHDREIDLEKNGKKEEAKEYGQIYRILVGLLDEMVELMGDEVVSSQEFGEILDAGLSEAKVGIIPPGLDQVQVGDITRSRLAHVKVLFFMGLNDGWVPKAGDGGGIVTDTEREMLQKNGIELAPTARENSYIQRFYLYQNLTKPSDALYLSWCSSSGEGTAMRPSYLVSVLKKLFPEMPIQREESTGSSISQITSKENGLQYLITGLDRIRENEMDTAWKELYRIYRKDTSYSGRVERLLRAAFRYGTSGELKWSTTKELYGETMVGSVTRLEQFAACAFAHFANYGLRLSERELYGVKAADLGIIFHRSMELFSQRIEKSGMSWNEINEVQQGKWMDECVEEVANGYRGGVLNGNARETYTVKRIKRILNRAVWVLHQQITSGSFVPADFEVSFQDIGQLEAVHVKIDDTERFHLQGRIDRIDTAEKEDKLYVKIVDYKSGSAKFDLISFYYGLQLQLITYLNAAMEMKAKRFPDKKVTPAGIFYHHLEDPVLEKEAGLSEQETQKRLLKKLRPDGLLNGEQEVLTLLDHSISGESLVIPVGLKKDGTPKANSSVVSEEQFEQLSFFATEKMEEMAGQIRKGDVRPIPFVDKDRNTCKYCSYADVCGFDRKIPGMCPNRPEELSKEEVMLRIAGRIKKGKNSDEK